MEIQTLIKNQITENNVVLYMKGTPESPQCGFSQVAVKLLQKHQVEFFSVNVLENPELREGVKQFANWPTFPQLYVKSELVGGCDILREMEASGELATLFAAS